MGAKGSSLLSWQISTGEAVRGGRMNVNEKSGRTSLQQDLKLGNSTMSVNLALLCHLPFCLLLSHMPSQVAPICPELLFCMKSAFVRAGHLLSGAVPVWQA